MHKHFILILVLWIAGPALLRAQGELDFEAVEDSFGAFMGHMTMQLGELDGCTKEFPHRTEELSRTKQIYKALMSNDLNVLNEVFHKLYDPNSDKNTVQELYDTFWNVAINAAPSIADLMNDLMNQTLPGGVHSKCQNMIDDVKGGEFRGGARLLRPFERVDPEAWRTIIMFLRN